MAEEDSDRNPIEVLAGEFAERYRAGMYPSVTEYIEKYPQWADEIRELFPSVVMIEQLRLERQSSRPTALESRKIERLGDYRIVREIGRGGMGVVYEAEQESLGRHVALKVLPERSLLAPKQLKRFQREARAAARLHHTNIVPVFGFGEHDGLHYYVMQFIPGRGLDEILHELTQLRMGQTEGNGRAAPLPDSPGDGAAKGVSVSELARALLANTARTTAGLDDLQSTEDVPTAPAGEAETRPLDGTSVGEALSSARSGTINPAPVESQASQPGSRYWRSVASIGVQVARALQYAHAQGTLHRDVKPANLIMDRQGTVWVADFGLAKLADVDDVTHTGDVVGTLRYMAPERFSGQSDARSDIYSLGLTLYELLTHRAAFDALDRSRLIRQVTQEEPPRPRSLDPHIPRDLETIVLKAIAREPQHRYQTAGQLADDLECFLEDRPIRARRITPAERMWRWCRRNRMVAALTMAAFTFLLLAAGVGMVGYVHTRAALDGESQQRERAETNLALALQAFDDIVSKLAPRGLHEPLGEPEGEEGGEEVEPGFYPVVTERDATILESVLPFYDRFAEQNTSSNLQREIAKANRSLGDIQQRLGRFPEAETAYRRAVAYYNALAKEANDDDACVCRTQIAAIYNDLGDVLKMTGRYADARDAHSRALGILAPEATGRRALPRTQFELARTHNALAALVRRRDRDRASQRSQHYTQAQKLLDDLVREQPDNPEFRLAQAQTYRHLSRTMSPEQRAETVDRAVAIFTELVEQYPADPDYRQELSETYAREGARLEWSARKLPPEQQQQQLDKAEEQLRVALEKSERLTVDYPTMPRYRASRAFMLKELGDVLAEQGHLQEGEDLVREALELRRKLADQFPAIPSYRIDLWRTRGLLSRILANREKYPEAEALVREQIDDATAYLKANPESDFRRKWAIGELARLYEDLSKLLLKQNRPKEAREAMRQAESLRGDRGRSESREVL